MEITAKKIKIFKIANRKGYAAICKNYLTEGKLISESYQRMVKALKRNQVRVKNQPKDIKELLVSFK
ncbi:MAG: hypothetical protein K9L84_04520 [Candidatus Omnitrophica bacterium]|nr:hypothetical protein [Candidatus Omnitrophota bacterium]MCF7894306.1 hypothetical protein [Candidatus Omnitrophota bacterium]